MKIAPRFVLQKEIMSSAIGKDLSIIKRDSEVILTGTRPVDRTRNSKSGTLTMSSVVVLIFMLVIVAALLTMTNEVLVERLAISSFIVLSLVFLRTLSIFSVKYSNLFAAC